MKFFYWCFLFIVITSCLGTKAINTVYVTTSELGPGSSGMAQVDSNSYLAVYDLKNFEKGPRLGFIKTFRDSIRVFPLEVDDWNSDEGIPSDLESITRIPDRGNEYLLAESGNWQGGVGRIFHISFIPEKKQVKVLGVAKIPMFHKNDIGIVGDQYEGIACYAYSSTTCNVILAERGGSEVYKRGVIRWGVLDLENYNFKFIGEGKDGIQVKAPGEWNSRNNRDLTDLYIDNEGDIWASASQDKGDSGPFYSVIYLLGKLSGEVENPIHIEDEPRIYKAFPGYKIEALSGPSSSAPESRFSFGTEDEIYGGTWRPIE